ncbi:MAG: hypothetical protein IKQ70_00315 [Bacteroidales bacterium]|nr:hypothetical protein [Bacteroidales bacterium]
MKKIILILSLILNSIIVSAQDIMFDTVFVVAAKYSLSTKYDKHHPYYDTKQIKNFSFTSYHKEYMGDSLIFDSNWDMSWQYSIENSLSLEFKNSNDTAIIARIKISNHRAMGFCFHQNKMQMGNKSGMIVPYTVLQRDKFDILLGNNDWTNEIIVAVVCQDYWSDKDHCYKKCDLANYKKYSPHYYEVCLVFFKEWSAASNYARRYSAIKKEYHKTHPNILARIGEMQQAGASRKEQKTEYKRWMKEAKNNKSN